MEMQYVCEVCGYHRPRLRSVQDHCRTKRAASTHPLGGETPISRRPMPQPDACECRACVSDARSAAPDDDAGFLRREDDRSACVADFTRLLTELKAVAGVLGRWTPAHAFLREPAPSRRSLPAKLADVFAGNVAGHLTWTHVWSAGNVRGSTRAGHLRVYGPHGWNSRPTAEVAAAAVAAFPARLERMWTAVEPRTATSLRSAMRAFAASGVAAMDADVFGEGSEPTVAATARLTREVAASFEEFAD